VIQEHSGLDIDAHPDAASLRAAIMKANVELEKPDAGRGSLIDQLYKKTARQQLINPTFIINHPTDLSPLARRSDDNEHTVDRFQLVVDTWEVVNAYSELVDPLDQRARLEEQARLGAAGDDEAMQLDEDYLLAMDYGMPPISGWGMGIDRFCALLTDVPNLRDVVWFPLMRPPEGEGEDAPASPGAPFLKQAEEAFHDVAAGMQRLIEKARDRLEQDDAKKLREQVGQKLEQFGEVSREALNRLGEVVGAETKKKDS